MKASRHNSEGLARGARMLRTALGPAITRLLEDASIVEVMLNPDGRIWIDRLSEGLSDTGEHLSPADGERILGHGISDNRLTVSRSGRADRPRCRMGRWPDAISISRWASRREEIERLRWPRSIS
ncbi:hypothetical protein CHELA40_12638 [Chelatococcus asaccharovorans]|nr:hypothetical protein CHELA40_12638 [Chelatococcus asaccharovorans]CAH1682085.1 hypothetical protein CHELA17_62977 [Chelatococcus asaccharovorans]